MPRLSEDNRPYIAAPAATIRMSCVITVRTKYPNVTAPTTPTRTETTRVAETIDHLRVGWLRFSRRMVVAGRTRAARAAETLELSLGVAAAMCAAGFALSLFA